MLPKVCPLFCVNQYKNPFPTFSGSVMDDDNVYPPEIFEDIVGGYTDPFVINELANVVPVHRLNAVNAKHAY